MASTKEQARKMVQTYLDEVEWGDDEFIRREEQKTRKERKQLPEGCLNSALYRDVMRIAWPSLVELLLASLASMVDMMMVGAMGPVIGDERSRRSVWLPSPNLSLSPSSSPSTPV